MRLVWTETGDPGDEPPVLLAHGLFGSGKNLGGLARRLAEQRRVISVDMRNHGDSPHSDEHSYPAMAGDLAEVIAETGGRADVVGHSMGGKAAMWLALTQPELMRKLVVLDIAPVAYGHSQMEYVHSMRALDLTGLKLRSEADRRLAAQIDDAGIRAFLLQSLDLKADPPRWKMNLDALEDRMSELTGFPDATVTPFTGPTLFLAGTESGYVRPRHHDAIMRLFPGAEIRMIEGAGHWLHAEQPQLIGQAVAEFLG